MRAMWNTWIAWVITNRRDFIIGAAYAVIFGLIFAATGIDSAARAVPRHIKNGVALLSVRRLQTRIADLERYRAVLVAYVAADKSLYLDTFRVILAVLILMCGGIIILIVGLFIWIGSPTELNARRSLPLAGGVFSIAIIIAAAGFRTALLDTRAKVSDLIAKLDGEIAGLKAKLAARTHAT